VCSMVVELPTAELGPDSDSNSWGRCSLRRDGRLLHVDRAGHPSVSSFVNTDATKEEYNASEPVHDRERSTDQFAHLMGAHRKLHHGRGHRRDQCRAAAPLHADI
jgi:hypothetical protein